MGYYDPPDPLIFPCPVSKVSNEDCPSIEACSTYVEPDNDTDNCATCGESEEDHHDCHDEADRAGVFDPPERDDY